MAKLFNALGLIFITLKLTNFIAWSWWWVLSPFWAPFLLVVIGAIIYTILEGKTK